MKEKANQYEADILQSLAKEKLNLHDLKDKAVVVSGENRLAEMICQAVEDLNKKHGLNIRLYRTAENIRSIDLCIETAFFDICDHTNPEEFANRIHQASVIISDLSEIQPQRVVLLSNGTVYGNASQSIRYAEKEAGAYRFGDDALGTLLMQSVENLFTCAGHQYGFDTLILRSGYILADFCDSTDIDELLNKILTGERISLRTHSGKSSYLYISDLLTALFYVIAYGENGGVYNAAGDEALSSAQIAALIDELFDDADVTLSKDGRELQGAFLDNTLIKKLGWSPKIPLRDALLIAVKSREDHDGVFMFPDAYDGKLSALQNTLLGMLKEIDRICRKHHIKYFLGGGSLLGAVRHHGFIPWDDDADVMMLRDDYERFLEILPDELPGFVFAQTHENEKSSHFAFTKLRLDHTVLSTSFTNRFDDVHDGVFLDVLAQDKTLDNRFISKIHIRLTSQFRWLVLNKWRNTKVEANSKAATIVDNIIKAILPLSVLEKIQNRLMSKYKKKDTKYLFDSMGRNITKGAFPKEWLDEAVYVDFEDTKLPIPKDYDKYLRYLYGDYMNMIPVSERHVSHSIARMDMGAYLIYKP